MPGGMLTLRVNTALRALAAEQGICALYHAMVSFQNEVQPPEEVVLQRC